MFCDDEYSEVCLRCGGPLFLLGALGALLWYRCRDCGCDIGHAKPERELTSD